VRKVHTVLVGTKEGTLACGDMVVRGCQQDLCGPERGSLGDSWQPYEGRECFDRLSVGWLVWKEIGGGTCTLP